MAIDPHFANVVLLLPCDGPDASTVFPDRSTSAKRSTAVGHAQLDTAQSKFGGSSLLLDGADDYATFVDSADWDFGTGPFTIELHARFAAAPTNAVLVCQWSGGFAFYFESGQLFFRSAPVNDSGKYTWSPTLNTWYHLCVDRDAFNVIRIYVDGVMVIKTTGYNHNISGSTAVLSIGSLRPAGFAGFDLNGHVDNVRITKGVARYASDGGFTAPTAAYPINDVYYSDVVILPDFNGTNGATTAPDESPYARALTFNGNAQLTSTGTTPWGDNVLLLDGVGDYVSAVDATELHFGSSSFTGEGYFRWAADPNDFQHLFGQWDAAANQKAWAVDYQGNSDLLRFVVSINGSTTVVKASATFVPTLGTWYHVAVSYDGTTYRLFVDGALVGSGGTSATLFNSTAPFTIGTQPDTTFPFSGRVAELRVTSGVARYTAAFSPPGGPWPRGEKITGDLILDYAIVNAVTKDLILDYEILSGEVTLDLILDNYIELGKSLTLDYQLGLKPPETWQHLTMIYPTGRDVVQEFGRSAATMALFVPGVAGAIHIPETPTLPAGVAFNIRLFYQDYYERIWLDPQLIRLVNPRYNTPIRFGIWNSYSSDNSLIEAINIDLPGFVLNFSIPLAFERYQYKFLTFSITPDAPARVQGSFDFIFDFGQATLDITATIIEVLRVLPNEPVREIWSWKTVLQTSYNSDEQRMAYRSEPRVNMSIDVQLLDETYRMQQYRQLYTFIARTIRFPFFQYRVVLDAPADIGDFKLFFDPTKTDLRPGEYAALMNPLTAFLSLVRINTVDVDGCTLDLALDFPVGNGWSILPTQAMRIPDASSLQMRATNGQLGISGESMEYRTLLRPDQTATLTMFDSLPVLDHRPIAQRDISEAFYGGGEVIDNESVMPALYTSWDNAFVAAPYEFKIDRETELDYWRQFGKTMQGRQNPFLMPTWRMDLELIEPAALGDIILHVDSDDYIGQFEFDTYKRFQIETENGIIYRKATAVESDGVGGCIITLTNPLGTNPGDNVINRISFLNVARLDNDNIELGHFVNWTIIGLKIRTINA